MGQIEQVQKVYQDLVDGLPPGEQPGEGLQEIRWMIEELRVSLFAQTLGTPYPVSDKRIYRAMDQVASDASS
jgi:ATP-dependent helicase HrpA